MRHRLRCATATGCGASCCWLLRRRCGGGKPAGTSSGYRLHGDRLCAALRAARPAAVQRGVPPRPPSVSYLAWGGGQWGENSGEKILARGTRTPIHAHRCQPWWRGATHGGTALAGRRWTAPPRPPRRQCRAADDQLTLLDELPGRPGSPKARSAATRAGRIQIHDLRAVGAADQPALPAAGHPRRGAIGPGRVAPAVPGEGGDTPGLRVARAAAGPTAAVGNDAVEVAAIDAGTAAADHIPGHGGRRS